MTDTDRLQFLIDNQDFMWEREGSNHQSWIKLSISLDGWALAYGWQNEIDARTIIDEAILAKKKFSG